MFRSTAVRGLIFALVVGLAPGCAESPDNSAAAAYKPTAAAFLADIEARKVATPTIAMDMAKTLIATYPGSPEATSAATWLAELQAANAAYNSEGAVSASSNQAAISAPNNPDRAAQILADADAELAKKNGGSPAGAGFVVVDEELIDEPIKTQVLQRLFAKHAPTERELRVEVSTRLKANLQRTGFKFHESPTVSYVYIFRDADTARNGTTGWMAMGSIRSGLSSTAKEEITIQTSVLDAMSTPSEIRFGLTEKQRRAVFLEISLAGVRAQRDAGVGKPGSDFKTTSQLTVAITEKFETGIKKKYKLSEDQLLEISIEGANAGWPDWGPEHERISAEMYE